MRHACVMRGCSKVVQQGSAESCENSCPEHIFARMRVQMIFLESIIMPLLVKATRRRRLDRDGTNAQEESSSHQIGGQAESETDAEAGTETRRK